MRHPCRSVGDSAADPHESHWQALVADVVSHLFVAAVENKGNDVVVEDPKTGQGQPCREAGGVLLGDAQVAKALWVLLLEIVKDP